MSELQHGLQVMEQRQLQKESMQRLNTFMEQVCNVMTTKC